MNVSDFQNLIKELYFHQDSKRGTKNTFIWLIEEIGELANLLKEQKLDKEKVSQEIADIIAWTISIANLLDIDVEKALNEKYPNKCIKCNENPCKCAK
jgi:NTP pyrophosphatase (non-canonical NTP hydrolase)